MKLEPEQIKILFRKVLKGTATADESEQLLNYLEQERHDMDDLLLPYGEWAGTEDNRLPEGVRERILTSVLKQTPVTGEGLDKTRAGRTIKMSYWLSRVAVVFVLILAGWGLFRKQSKPGNKTWIVFAAAKGERRTMMLPDSSKVLLNAGSQVAFQTDFAGNERCVKLTGEAYFEVKHDPRKPFIVLSDVVRTTVLGTAFNVKAYPEDKSIDITVINGKVKVAQTGKDEKQLTPVILTKGMHVGYQTRDTLFRVSKVDAAAMVGWKDNKLVFEEATLEEICNTLARNYNVKFTTITPVVWQHKYSLTFDQLTLDESLDQLRLLGALTFQRKDSIVVLRDKH